MRFLSVPHLPSSVGFWLLDRWHSCPPLCFCFHWIRPPSLSLKPPVLSSLLASFLLNRSWWQRKRRVKLLWLPLLVLSGCPKACTNSLSLSLCMFSSCLPPSTLIHTHAQIKNPSTTPSPHLPRLSPPSPFLFQSCPPFLLFLINARLQSTANTKATSKAAMSSLLSHFTSPLLLSFQHFLGVLPFSFDKCFLSVAFLSADRVRHALLTQQWRHTGQRKGGAEDATKWLAREEGAQL